MILPTKRISEQRALLYVGGDILSLLTKDKTVSRLWDELKKKRQSERENSTLTFDWFILSLDLLFMMNIINIEDGIIGRIAS
ncbi:MAG: hypothetical protein KKH41_05370 [Candidatus Thermoplasmatota archaeon]|nr:hypothetical protein [Euryarchaeota archaeon]MBU4071045.1 hypothetical protein [Candidatus Thermoplasmatota archaeon]MBU4144118.1 hypothetical protein [Candidatus Thermoplasmatota archaeon]MBU4591997.1 hypothetical protein [Candidatus Thermoplasmatota archaeon]